MTADTDIKDNLKDTNFGLASGGGIMIPLGPGMVIAEGQLQSGLDRHPEGHSGVRQEPDRRIYHFGRVFIAFDKEKKQLN